jgi:hypothetical protein
VPNPWLLATGLALALIATLLLRRGLRLAHLLRQIPGLPESTLDQLPTGLVKTQGRLHAPEPLQALLSRRPACYYFIKVESEPRDGKPAKQLAAVKRWAPSQLEGPEGAVNLQPWTPLVASSHKEVRHVQGLTSIPDEQADLYEALGITQRHLKRIQPYTIIEYRFEPGDHVHVIGTHDPKKGIYRAKHSPFTVTQTHDLGFLQGLRRELVLWTAIPPMAFIAAAIIIGLAFA